MAWNVARASPIVWSVRGKRLEWANHNNVHLNPSLVENFKLSYGKMTYLSMPLG